MKIFSFQNVHRKHLRLRSSRIRKENVTRRSQTNHIQNLVYTISRCN